MAVFLTVPSHGEGKSVLSSVRPLSGALCPSREAYLQSLTQPQSLPKAPPPNVIALGVGASIWESGGDTKVWSRSPLGVSQWHIRDGMIHPVDTAWKMKAEDLPKRARGHCGWTGACPGSSETLSPPVFPAPRSPVGCVPGAAWMWPHPGEWGIPERGRGSRWGPVCSTVIDCLLSFSLRLLGPLLTAQSSR